MKLTSYHQGKVYSLEQIKPITQQFKFVLSRSSAYGRFFLYKQKGNNHLWIGGPFAGHDSNLFLYLGRQSLPKGLTSSFSKIILRNLENDWKKFQESREDHVVENYGYLSQRHSFQYRRWATDFFTFSNDDFAKYYD